MQLQNVRIGKTLMIDLEGKELRTKVKEIREACRQYPEGAVVATSGSYVYTFNPSGAKLL